MTSDIIKQELRNAFATVLLSHTASSTETESLLETFELAYHFSDRFWTANYLDDLVVNFGSGIFISPRILLKLYNRFVPRISVNTYASQLDSSINASPQGGGWDFANPWTDLCTLVVDRLEEDAKMYASTTLMAQEEADYHRPITATTGISAADFIQNNAWLVPLYLLFTTGAFKEVLAEVKPT